MPVLREPVIDGLNLKRDGVYVDGTFGRGGHASAILQRLGPAGRLLAIDRDGAAIDAAAGRFANDPRIEFIHGRFSEIARYATERHLTGKVDGLLLDLGVSSPQLDQAERGFSFRRDGPLDMRMDTTRGESAAEWLATVDELTLKNVLKKLGEEKFAARIARAIVAARRESPISRTGQLADIVRDAVPLKGGRKDAATKTFQAIRMHLNRELDELSTALAASLDLLAPGGRLCVISFHSLEDRMVKRFMRDAAKESPAYRGLPDVPVEYRPKLRIVGKPVAANEAEIAANVRARSARLRIAERLA